jgi:hypothetical protein
MGLPCLSGLEIAGCPERPLKPKCMDCMGLFVFVSDAGRSPVCLGVDKTALLNGAEFVENVTRTALINLRYCYFYRPRLCQDYAKPITN